MTTASALSLKNTFAYHTKVPYKAIMRYILHYTKPGDIVLDGFCGTGMTGVAAQMCGCPDTAFKYQLSQEMKDDAIEWGTRNAVLVDLSPAATFIASVYNTCVDTEQLHTLASHIINECIAELGWMYETPHVVNCKQVLDIQGKPIMGHVNFFVWSDVFICSSCSNEINFWEQGVDKSTGRVCDAFKCPVCGSILTKRDCERKKATVYDDRIGKQVTISEQVPVLVNYSVGREEYERPPIDYDLKLLEKIASASLRRTLKAVSLPNGFNTEQPRRSHGINYIHQFFTRRNLAVLELYWAKIKGLDIDTNVRNTLYSVATGVMMGLSKLQRYRMFSTFPNMLLSGTLYIGSTVREWNALDWMRGKLKSIEKLKSSIKRFANNTLISTMSSTTIADTIPSNSIDYIFIDPPFGGNLNYSELSSIWEAWIAVLTSNHDEAIINEVQRKALVDYQVLMQECFRSFYRVLKPGHWITIEFHNSHNSVWNAITESLLRVGFILADIRVLDKKQGSFKQIVHTSAVKQDLVITAYKPRDSFVQDFQQRAGDPDMAWEFVRQHLANVPIAPDGNRDGKIDMVAERCDYLLFDRMVAYHIMNGIPVPMDAHTFYDGLRQRFLMRDGMFFLPDQVNEYDEKRTHMELDTMQLSFIVSDEKNAIMWLNYILSDHPQTYQEIQPQYLQELHQQKSEAIPELLDMLRDNFLQDDEGKWYIPDLSSAADLAKLRLKKLVKEFYDTYVPGKGKLKVFRMEAIRAGFDECWSKRDYKTIVHVGERLPDAVLQEDPALLMYYDNACSRV